MPVGESPPMVTVTIPTYNRARMLSRALESVLEQSFAKIQVFVSDNASNDDTAAVVESFGDPRVHYIRNETNVGVHGNLSRGLVLGDAPLLAILPDDDVMLPGSLERRVRILEQHPNVDIVHSASQLVHFGLNDEALHGEVVMTGGPENSIEPAGVVLRKLLTGSYWINFPAALIRRSIVGDVRFEPSDGVADDLGMFLRLVSRAQVVAYIAEPLVSIRMHPGAHSTRTGFHELQLGAFRPDFVAIEAIQASWARFLAQRGHGLEGLRDIRATSRRWIRGRLMQVVKRKTFRDEGVLRRCKLLFKAASIEPTVLMTPSAARFLLIGPK